MESLPNTDALPLRFIGRQWYLRKRLPSGQRIERGLGTSNKDEALRRARQVVHDHLNAAHLTAWQAKVAEGMGSKGWLRMMCVNSNRRAAKKGGNLDLASLELIATRSGGVCEVSGIPFYTGTDKLHPFQPSIDRVDSALGYDPSNVRMVCLAVNYCMSHWGADVFHAIAAAAVSKRLAEMASIVDFPQICGGKMTPQKNAEFVTS